jgi:guanylate kinase
MAQKGTLLVVSGPSGVGKGTICREVVKKTNTTTSVSVTTREKSDIETEGNHYYFISKQEFENRIANNEFLEYAEVFGNYYGTPKDKTEQMLDEGNNVILEIDVQGGIQAKEQYPETVMIFILPPNEEELASRIAGRGRGEDEATLKRRLDAAKAEIAIGKEKYDHLVINDRLEEAVKEVINFIEIKTGEQ